MNLEFYPTLPLKKIAYILVFCFYLTLVNTSISQNQVFASSVISSNNVTNPTNAVGDTPEVAVLNSYGGTVIIDPPFTGELELEFANTIPANTTTYVKIDFDEDLLNYLLGGSVGGLLADIAGTVIFGNHYFRIEARNNTTTVLSNSTLTAPSDFAFRLVTGSDGQFYIAVTPEQSYNRIYIQDVTSALLFGDSNSMNIYSAFYFTENQCATDPLFTDYDGDGISVSILNLGANVNNPEFAIDNDDSTFSEISMGLVNVVGTMRQNVYFPNVYTPDDEFTVDLKIDPLLIDVGILNNVKVTAYEGTLNVFEENFNSVITLELLTLLQNGERASVPFSPGVSFDRVSVSITSLIDVSLLQSLDFYGVTIVGTDAPTTNETIQSFCLVEDPVISDLQTNEVNVVWYDQPTGGNAYDPADSLTNGLTYYASQIVDGCESSTRLEVEVLIEDTPTPTTSAATQSFCVVNAPTVADLDVNEPNITWYDAAVDGNPYDPTDPLVNGLTYYAAATGANGCESSTRLEVEVLIEDTPTPTTSATTQSFCVVNTPTVADLDVNEPNITWYDAAVDGNPYDPTDPLVNGLTYYAAATGVNGCESSTRLEVEVLIEDTPTPTTSATTQSFCVVNAPTVADLDVNEPNITWYDAAVDGNPYDPTDPLVNGLTYYAAATGVNGCESSTRLEVEVLIEDTPTPTTSATTQSFCVVNTPTVADLDVNETNITWYDAAVDGNPYDPTDPLVNGLTYYAAATGANGCESSTRLEVEVLIEDTPTPTTSATTQSFCVVNTPTVADLDVNEPNITWYDAAVDGNPYDPTDPLVNGLIYYAAATGANGCESSTRLEVEVLIEDTPTPTTSATTQSFCVVNTPTVADLDVNEPNITWYDAAVDGNPYDPTDPLVNGLTYYAAATGANGCESSTRLEVEVIIEDTPTPTTSATTQSFCVVNAPTVADLDVNEPNITWYDAAVDGNPYDPTDPLVNGLTYYAAATGANGCESSTRLEVEVLIEDTPTPTTSATTQSFCVVNTPTVADLDVNETNITWYDAAVDGNPYDPTDPLVNGLIYYAAATGANGCESSTRLEVEVLIEDTPTPTTSATTQSFCVVNAPTVADLDVNEPNITWYDAAVDGNPYDPTDPLVNGLTYYAAATGANGCESSTRLEVEVLIEDTPTPTTSATTQSFCVVNTPTVADLDVNETNITWYDAAVDGNPYDPTDPLVNGLTYYAAATGANGCESSTRLEVEVLIEDTSSPTISSNSNGEICLNTEISYTTEPGNENYIWNVTGGIVNDGGTSQDNFISILWDSLENTTVSVSYDSINSCGSQEATIFEEIVTVCADIEITKTVDEPNPAVGQQVTFLITVSNSGPNDFTNVMVSENMPSGYTMTSSSTSMGTYNPTTGEWFIDLLPANETGELRIVAEVLGQGDYLNIASIEASTPTDANADNNSAETSVDPICLFVYNEFTPNDDGINDHFVISCIENYPKNELKVFNRYGSLVYAKRGYNNTWNGVANVSGVDNSGKILPSETYYYVFTYSDGSDPMTGWLFLLK